MIELVERLSALALKCADMPRLQVSCASVRACERNRLYVFAECCVARCCAVRCVLATAAAIAPHNRSGVWVVSVRRLCDR
jgi:hypothetical protein